MTSTNPPIRGRRERSLRSKADTQAQADEAKAASSRRAFVSTNHHMASDAFCWNNRHAELTAKHCSPGKIPEPDENMLHDFTQDDLMQKPSIREKVSKSNSYWFGDWLNLFLYLYNICYCLRGEVMVKDIGCHGTARAAEDPMYGEIAGSQKAIQ
ncbi:hypothetical protein AAHC03_09162 [Spirometra sp. Aus1]